MIEFKKTEINLMYLLSKFFDVDYDGEKFYCHSCHDITIDRDYLYSMLIFNDGSKLNVFEKFNKVMDILNS